MAATARPRNCTATPNAEGCGIPPPPSKPLFDTMPGQVQIPMENKTTPAKPSSQRDVSGESGDVHPIYGKFVRITDLLSEEDKANRPKMNESHNRAAGSAQDATLNVISTLSVPVSRPDSNVTGIGIGSLRQPISGGAGSPNPASVIVPAVLGGILATVLAIVLVVVLLRRRKNGFLFRKNKNINCEIEMDVIAPKTGVTSTTEVPMYAVVDRNKKNKVTKSSSPEQQPLRPLSRECALQNGTGSSSTLRMISRLSLPEPPLPERTFLDNSACASDTENEYDIPDEHQYEDTEENGTENVYESTEDINSVIENVYESTEDVSKVENVYETTEGNNEYALYDAAHRGGHVDGIIPDPLRIPNGFAPADNVEDHVYESTEGGGENIYESTDWPTRPPLPPIRPLSLPVLKTPPQIRPGHLLPKSSRPNTIGAEPPKFNINEYNHNPDDYDAYLSPICHDHSWSPYHTYDPVYEKGKTDKNSMRNSSGHICNGHDTRSNSCHSSELRNRVLPKSLASDSDSSVYEYIEGGDNRQSVCKSDISQTDSLTVENDAHSRHSPREQSTVNIEEDESEHEYTPLTDASTGSLPCFDKHPVEPEADDNIYEPYAFHQRT